MEVSMEGKMRAACQSRELGQLPSITGEATCELSRGGRPLPLSRRVSRAFPAAPTKSGVALERRWDMGKGGVPS
jgi:hypothetical protein